MSPLTLSEDARRCARTMQDALAGNDALREGLRDEDAIPFVEWGRAQAEAIAARRALPEAEAADAGMLLADLLSTMTWAVVYRHSKDATWLGQTLHTLNSLCQDLYGEDAPQLSEEAIAAWVAGHADRSDGDLLRELMAHFALPDTLSAAPGAPTGLSGLAGLTPPSAPSMPTPPVVPPPAAHPLAVAPATTEPAPAAGLSTLAGLTASDAPEEAPPPEQPAEEPPPQPHSFFGLRLPGRRRPPPPPGEDHE